VITAALLLAAAASCGVERSDVKRMSDEKAGRVDLRPAETSVDHLASLPAPDPPVVGWEARGAPGREEFRVYQVAAIISCAKIEDDRDVHVCACEPAAWDARSRRCRGPSLVAELVDPACARGSRTLNEIIRARARLVAVAGGDLTEGTLRALVGRRVTLEGVAFYDRLHGQTGAPKNGVELHPLLRVIFAQ